MQQDIPLLSQRYIIFLCTVPFQLRLWNHHMSTSIRNVDHVLTDYTFQEYYVAEVTQCLQNCLRNKCVSFTLKWAQKMGTEQLNKGVG